MSWWSSAIRRPASAADSAAPAPGTPSLIHPGRRARGLEFSCRTAQNSYVIAADVIGREKELADLGSFLDAIDELPAALLVEGEPGIGKTVILGAGVDLAWERGFRALAAMPAPAETRLAFAALGDLLEPVLDEVLPALPGPQQSALEVALLLAEPRGPPPDARTVDVALLGALRTLATGPLLVAVDDVQWLDAPSAAALAFAVRRLHEEPVAVVLTRRLEDAAAPSLPLDLGRWTRETTRLRLGPLSLGALQRLLRARLELVLPRPTLRRVHERAGGNPFFALEIARALQRREGNAAVGEVPVPRDLDALVRERLAPLPESTTESLLVVSAAAEPSIPLLAQCLGPGAMEALRPALAARVVERDGERIQFSHPLLAASVYGHADPEERRLLHWRLAALVVSPEERARHLALGAAGADAGVAAALDAAAADATARGAPATAAELLELAIRLTPTADRLEFTRRKLDAAASHFAAGDVARTRAIVEPLLSDLPRGRERARAALQLGWASSGMRESKHELERAVAEAELDPTLLVGAHYLLAYVTLVMGDLREARQNAQVALELAEEGPDEGVMAQCLACSILMDTLAGRPVAEEVVERALALEARNPQMPTYYPPSLTCGQRAMFKGRFDEARRLMARAYRRVAERGDEFMLGGVRWHQAELECRAGSWELAAGYAAEGYAVTEPADYARQSVLLYTCALIAAHRGRVEEARASAERACQLSRLHVSERAVFDLLSQAVLGFLELSLGRAAAAVRVLRPLPDALDAVGFGEPSVCPTLPDLIEALVELDEVEEAKRLLVRLERQARTTDSMWARAVAARCRGLVATAAGDPDAARAAFASALEAHALLPEPFQRARTLLVYGVALRRAKQRRRARELLEGALAIFQELGAALWVERAKAELNRVGGRAPARGRLTPVEARVAELVAEGRTNREVGAALNLSARTVEGHLSRVYGKLGVRSRVELARRGPPPRHS